MLRSPGIVPFAAAILAIAPAVARAQAPGETVRLRVVPDARTRAPRTEWIGTVERFGTDSVVLRAGSRRRALPRDVVQRVWVRREARSRSAAALRWGIPAAALGTLVGAGLGAAGTEAELCTLEPGGGCTGGGKERVVTGALLGGVGFGVSGAALGSTYGRYGWRSVDLRGVAALQVDAARVTVVLSLR